jgi:hypothetical protein
MPFALPSSFSFVSSSAGDSFLPSIETASPYSKPMVISVALSGAVSGEMVR